MTDKNKANNRKRLVRLELAAYVVWHTILSFFKSIGTTFAPEVDRRSGGRLSFAVRTVFGVLTLEGPRLMLLSRYRAARMKRGTKVGISAISGSAVAAIILATIMIGSQLIAVTVDGKLVGYVENEAQYASLLQRAKDKIAEKIGTENTEIVLEDSGISLETVIVPQQQQIATTANDLTAADEEGSAEAETAAGAVAAEDGEEMIVDSIVDSLLGGSAIKATVYSININGKDMATLGSMKDATDVLNAVANKYNYAEGEYTGRFADDISINTSTIDLSEVNVQTPADAASFLLAGTTEENSYVADEGDNAEMIAESLGISERALRDMYPDYNFGKVEKGDVFAATRHVSYIRYEITGNEVNYEPVQFETVEEKTDELYLGQREVKVEGKLGNSKVTRFVTRINGEIVASEDISSEIVLEPEPEIVSVGVKLAYEDVYVGPSDGTGGYGGNGPLGRPLDGYTLTRSIGGGHNGADMCAPRGTPIYAAAYGVVSFAGVYGGYGNLVIMDHGNGLQTYYAHCDTFNVVAGQTVDRGNQIATVGTTGRSTAYHLHFEVRVNGVVMEPLDWI